MSKKISIYVLFSLFTFSLTVMSDADAQSRFQQIQSGVNASTAGGSDNSDEESSGEGGKKTGRMGKPIIGKNTVVFLGVFENYLPTKRYNARLTVYGEPRKFLLGHRACKRIVKIRDRINQYFFDTKLKVGKRGKVDTTGMDAGVRKAIKKALKTKLEYFTSIYVYSGRYNVNKLPKELKEQEVTDCAGVISKKKDMDKAEK